jgi:signal transduction histidine kinase
MTPADRGHIHDEDDFRAMSLTLGRLTLGTKLLIAPSVGVVALAVVAAIALWDLTWQQSTMRMLNDQRFAHLQLAIEANAVTQQAQKELSRRLAAPRTDNDTRLARSANDELVAKIRSALPTLDFLTAQKDLSVREADVIARTTKDLRGYAVQLEVSLAAQQNDAGTLQKLQGQFDLVSSDLTNLVGTERQLTSEAFAQSQERLDEISVTFTVLLGVALFATIVATVIVTRHVRSKVQAIHTAATQISSGNLAARAEVSGDDEIGQTARAFNFLVDELARTTSRLVDAARRAGMAEIATNVLHNVGNALNSVNVSASLIRRTVVESKVESLANVVQMFDAHSRDLAHFLSDDPKGKLVPRYIEDLAKTLAQERSRVLEDLARLAASVEHIIEIVAMQQSYAGYTANVVEAVRVQDLIDDALRMKSESFLRSHVKVTKDIPDLPLLPLDKHRMLLILVNLLKNAGQAMAGNGDRPSEIKLKVELADFAPDMHTLRVLVTDTGEGIAPENLTRIFSHGFTTRAEGHGFGLHSCALAAMEMGGRLTATSDGPGRGATFILEVPVAASS